MVNLEIASLAAVKISCLGICNPDRAIHLDVSLQNLGVDRIWEGEVHCFVNELITHLCARA